MQAVVAAWGGCDPSRSLPSRLLLADWLRTIVGVDIGAHRRLVLQALLANGVLSEYFGQLLLGVEDDQHATYCRADFSEPEGYMRCGRRCC